MKNPDTGEHIAHPIHLKKDMYHGPYTPWGPDIMPLPLDKQHMPVCFFGFQSREPVYKNNTLFGNHLMEGIVMAHGNGARVGGETHGRLIDMAPTILYLLGLPVPDDMDGQVLEDLLDPALLQSMPITKQKADAQDGAGNAGLTDEEEEELRARLEGLGYL